MEIIFKTQLLTDLYEGNKVKEKEFNSNPTLIKQYIKTVNKLRSVNKIEQLMQFNSLNYKKLSGNNKGISAIRINQQYRLLFLEIKSENEPYNVEVISIEEISKHYE